MRFLFSFISRFHKIDLSTNSTKSSSNDRIMIALNLPTFDIKLSGSKQHPLIFDILRRKRVALTPEEWVRQHFIHYLVEHKGYPAELLANEIKLQIGNKNLRADSVLYDRNMHPRMIIEYKAPSVALTQHVFDQIFAYNTLLHVDYIIVSNGLDHYCCHIDYQSNTFNFIKEIPDYTNL